jgi:magnesium chelatase family protein
VLREPLETGCIHVSRAARQSIFPAQFQFVAAMNPCPCGWRGHASGRCACTPDQVRRYRWRVSGALYDRIDVSIDVPAVDAAAMMRGPRPAGEESAAVRERVADAFERQIARQGKANGRLGAADVERWCVRSHESERLLGRAMGRHTLSARGYHRVLKVARTIADLVQCERIECEHIAEAIGYRREIGAAPT